ncbi:MFS transporter [Bordetella bronchialis]|uniref:MFS transporter n=1 Tax=Bordetella bronchialis TaxID=463025 RepID=A0A193FLE0_9BORD|nr:MFS transporter [Bordetella bronchialis]ANN68480.1 MFS transporter [Bordetella bronchialis]ANN73621.1 MFS transporter [Bordetella bronchialis]
MKETSERAAPSGAKAGGIAHALLAHRLGPVLTISLAQLLGTSLWFSANSAADDLARAWGATAADIGLLTSAVQTGFILGTLAISISGLADRFRASAIFVCSAVAGAACNAAFAWLADGIASGAVFRFLVGLSLAGIYPVGMKLIVGWAPDRTGAALAQLVAMLTLGTALPHALRAAGAGLPWQAVIAASSALALLGAAMIRILGDGPGRRDAAAPLAAAGKALPAASAPEDRRPTLLDAFRARRYRAAALGYFGHMWELYAFWTLVPLLIARSSAAALFPEMGVSAASFCVIGIGALGCLLGGALSRKLGSAKVALGALALSGVCALVFSLGWPALPAPMLAVLLLVWGAAVVADSPQFSALSARACPPQLIGSALAIQNAIGFAITIVSIAGAMALFQRIGLDATWLLVPGPVLGLLGYALASREKAPKA